MEWDLFLDESGSFEQPGEHTLIGGVLINHIHHPDNAMFKILVETSSKSNLRRLYEYATQGLELTGRLLSMNADLETTQKMQLFTQLLMADCLGICERYGKQPNPYL